MHSTHGSLWGTLARARSSRFGSSAVTAAAVTATVAADITAAACSAAADASATCLVAGEPTGTHCDRAGQSVTRARGASQLGVLVRRTALLALFVFAQAMLGAGWGIGPQTAQAQLLQREQPSLEA